MLIINHDAFDEGIDFEQWLYAYQHRTLILNVKEEGLETRLIDLMDAHRISDFFFLDQSFPFLVKTSHAGERRCAARVSEYESVETALALAGRIDWVWVDCFTRFPLKPGDYACLKAAGFKLCLVSPELQGRDPVKAIPEMSSLLDGLGMTMDAVCTKRADIWERISK